MVIDVLIAIDAEGIIQKYGHNNNSQNATSIDTTNLLYMVTKQGPGVTGNAGGALNIAAEPGDEVRWRETTLSLNSQYQAILYEFVRGGGNGKISKPEPREVTVKVPLPNEDNPLQLTNTQEVNSYFWSSTMEKAGSVTYHFKFMIVDRHANVQGYYSWDPYITISD